MGLSEKVAYDSIKEFNKDKLNDDIRCKLGFILQVAYDNENWNIVKKLFEVISNR